MNLRQGRVENPEWPGVESAGHEGIFKAHCAAVAKASNRSWTRRRAHHSCHRGRTYGTLLVDLERHQPIDVLPDTKAETLAAWLQAQPQLQVISRDRAGHFAKGAKVGAPQAIQVADGWHLLRNLGEMVQRLLARHPAALCAAAQVGVTTTAAVAQETETTVPVPAPLTAPLLSPREQRFREVLARHAEGWSCRRIAQEVSLHWRTVKRYILARELPKRGAPILQATSAVVPYLAYLEPRWQEGCRVSTAAVGGAPGPRLPGQPLQCVPGVEAVAPSRWAAPDTGGHRTTQALCVVPPPRDVVAAPACGRAVGAWAHGAHRPGNGHPSYHDGDGAGPAISTDGTGP